MSGGGKEVERVQALPRNPPHWLAVETSVMGRKPARHKLESSLLHLQNQPEQGNGMQAEG
jgi:hypothetical protein